MFPCPFVVRNPLDPPNCRPKPNTQLRVNPVAAGHDPSGVKPLPRDCHRRCQRSMSPRTREPSLIRTMVKLYQNRRACAQRFLVALRPRRESPVLADTAFVVWVVIMQVSAFGKRRFIKPGLTHNRLQRTLLKPPIAMMRNRHITVTINANPLKMTANRTGVNKPPHLQTSTLPPPGDCASAHPSNRPPSGIPAIRENRTFSWRFDKRAN